MQASPTSLPEVIELTPVRHGDARGWFSEVANRRSLSALGIDFDDWAQDNESFSAAQGTIRGIHFQLPPDRQLKLVRVTSGSILDVAVDLRRSSPTFGQHVAVELDAASGNQLFIPAGFGHGFCTLTPDCQIAYKVAGGFHAPESEGSIRWNDPDIGIAWPVTETDAHLSPKDKTAPFLARATRLFT